jgi:glutamate/tyrosine decarboxylase-like PLP-dependent enzyme
MAGSLVDGAGSLFQSIFNVTACIDSRLEEQSPSSVILATTTTILALSILRKYFQGGWGKTGREQIGEFALRLTYVKEKYAQDIDKQLVHFQESVKKKWEHFTPLFTTIPEEGLSTADLLALIENYSRITYSAVKDKHLSGTIYSKNFDSEYENGGLNKSKENPQKECLVDDPDYFEFLSKKLQTLFTLAFEQSYLWNSLHSDEFSVGACIDYQVVRMVASMFGGSPNEVMGFVTSGGTESLMLAVRAYRDWGIKNRGHKPGDGVIIAGKSVHAAILKAGKASLVNVVLVETNETGKINIKQLRETVKNYGSKIIAIIGSAPSYPKGVMDPIEEMGKIAQDNGFGMHVDCCLGAFIVNNLLKYNTDYLKMSGITSLSADTHKNGLAPKGSSVLVTKKLDAENLAYYSIYSVPEWSGGVYGTPKDAGSQSCVQSLNALLALLGTGQSGYRKIAQTIHETTSNLAALILQFKGRLRLIADPEVNVVVFQVDENWGLQRGATYAFAHEMAKRKFVLNTLSNDTAHFCITLRFASSPNGLNQFEQAAEESLTAIKELNDELTREGKKFSGDAGMYCALEAAMTPDRKTLSSQKYIENLLLGQQGAQDAVRAYFLAQLDPYSKG